MKTIDPTSTIFELTEQYPELIGILKELGFLGVANPVVRNTVGRKTSLVDGCKLQRKDLESVLRELQSKGFTVDQRS